MKREGMTATFEDGTKISGAKVLRQLQVEGETINDIKRQYDELSDSDRDDLFVYAFESGDRKYLSA